MDKKFVVLPTLAGSMIGIDPERVWGIEYDPRVPDRCTVYSAGGVKQLHCGARLAAERLGIDLDEQEQDDELVAGG